MKFRKKPAVIEAEQFTAEMMRSCVLKEAKAPEGVVLMSAKWHQERREVYSSRFAVRTLEGEMEVSPGDWIIRGVKGEFYPCKPDIFAATYEPADAPPAPSPHTTGEERTDAEVLDAQLFDWCEHGHSRVIACRPCRLVFLRRLSPAPRSSGTREDGETIWTTAECPTCGTEVEGIRVLPASALPVSGTREDDGDALEEFRSLACSLRSRGHAGCAHEVEHMAWLLWGGDKPVLPAPVSGTTEHTEDEVIGEWRPGDATTKGDQS